LAGLFFAALLFPLLLFFTGLRAELFLAVVPFLAAGLFLLVAVFLPAVVAGLRFFVVLVLFLDTVPFFAAVPAVPFLAADVPFFAVEVLLFPFTVPEVFLEDAVFLPEVLRELPPLLFLPLEALVFGIAVSLLNRFHSISVFLLI
jgi:hypothetical protein